MTFPSFRSRLLYFCNLSFSLGQIPDILKVTRLVPIPKENAIEFKDFLQISISLSLPIEIKEARSLKVFKARLKRHLLDKQVCK